MSGENTPTLCYATPAFEKFIEVWTQIEEDNPAWTQIIDPGLTKLVEYQEKVTDAYDLAMGKIYLNSIYYYCINII